MHAIFADVSTRLHFSCRPRPLPQNSEPCSLSWFKIRIKNALISPIFVTKQLTLTTHSDKNATFVARISPENDYVTSSFQYSVLKLFYGKMRKLFICGFNRPSNIYCANWIHVNVATVMELYFSMCSHCCRK